MKELTLAQIAEACGGTLIGGNEAKEYTVTGVEIDSRRVKAGDLFVAIPGEKVDGHKFIPDVLKKGAYALSQQSLDVDGAYILVEDTVTAMKRLARFYRSTLDIKVVGITGSVGKTSTKEMIASVLDTKFRVHKTQGNFNNGIGLPLTIFQIEKEHQVAVLEMGISEFGEMHELADMAQPDIMVITNIGLCHLENLKTRDGILKAKTESFAHLKPDGVVILNGDDDKLSTVEQVAGRKPVFYGIKGRNLCETSVCADAVTEHGLEGMTAEFHTPQGDMEVFIPIPGEHNVYNALAATCVAEQLGLSMDEIKCGIAAASTISGRTNLIHTKGMTVIDDCYNANPVSMKASLDVLSKAGGRKIAVLGDMGELGEDEKQLHYKVGTYAGTLPIDLLFCVGTLSGKLAEGAKKQNPALTVKHYATREEMTEELLATVKEGDAVLVKASHFMEFPKVVAALTEA
ncbi:MAG: UDP-N-acetylmuramoyl-tripeptide--D-alanyl-D-alanine ligase [Lachnospiraceae bacterium]|nr:UDP-N-acetylmuramoyl-tripeptide--D-alanyl-D-alanine ligase [Lachnospiraceae bacterium]MDD6304503.1 UDP-N-acetylmuramoyl-tripeptide--D-alanyl-D-alanine ligase [Lachnospiraceae bacterium]